MSKLLHCIYSCSFKEFCKLRTDTLNTEKICVIAPFEDKLIGNSCIFSKSLTSGKSSTLFKKLICGLKTCLCKLPGICLTYAFNVN